MTGASGGAGSTATTGPAAGAGPAAPEGRAGGWGSDLAIVAAAVIAAAMTHYRTYDRAAVLLLVVGVAALGWAVLRGAGWHAPRPASVAVALLVSLALQLLEPPHRNAEVTGVLWAAVWLSAALTVATAALLLLRPRWRWPVGRLLLGGLAAAYAMVVAGSPRALIDVWVILQGAAAGMWRGDNPYTMRFGQVPAGQVNDCFNYLPATFAVPAPGWWLLGDVRYTEAALMFAGVAAVVWRARRAATASRVAVPVALLVGLLAGSLHDVQQAWNETMLVGLLVGAAVLADRGRTWWAVACLAVAVATKQHVAVLLPLLLFWPAFGWRRTAAAAAGGAALILPWFLASPQRFTTCTLTYFLDLPPRHDSLSIWQWLPHGVGTVVLLLIAALGYALAVTRLPRDGAGLLLGWGLVLAGWDLVNKQSFLNQWLLVAQLVVAGVALAASRAARPETAPPPPPPAAEPEPAARAAPG